jgi:MFS family permease
MASTWGIASIAGPIVGGWVTDTLSWRWIFWANLPIALIAMLLCDHALRLLPVRSGRARIDWAGAGLLTAAVSAWLLVLSWGGVEMPWTAPPILALGAVGLVLLVLLAMQERRFAEPILPPRLFANPVFTRGVAIAFCCSLALFGGSFLLPLFFQLVMGVDAASSGALVVPFLASNCVGSMVSGVLARRHGKTKAIIVAGLAACLVGFVLLALMGATTSHFVMICFQSVLGFGIGMVMPASLVCVQNAADRHDIGAATGCLLFLRSMGGAFGSTLVGALLAKEFATRLAALGITAHIDLGAVRPGAAAIPGVPSAMLPHLPVALSGAFHIAFLACAVAMVPAVLVALGMRDLPLRTTSANEPVALAH